MTPAARVREGRPHFTGLRKFTDAQGRYEFRHPSDWPRSELDNDLDGIIISPPDGDDETYFAVSVTDLEIGVVADDLEVLRSGFDDGIAALPEVEVEDATENTYNNIVRIERVYTFVEDGVRRKRRAWSMYADHWQFVVVFQGSTVEEYHYWFPMGNYCFMAFQLPMALWFATDPTVTPPAS